MKILYTADELGAAGAPPQQEQQQDPKASAKPKVDKARYNKMLGRLGLKPDADDEDVFDAIDALLDNAASAKAANAKESEINKLISQSGGALDRKRAQQVLDNRASYAESNKKPARKK